MAQKSEVSEMIHSVKYRQEGESFEESMSRIALTLSDDAPHFYKLRDILNDQRFLPAGRVQAAIGAEKTVTAYNCFVSGTISDSFVSGEGSIMDRAKEAATTLRMGGGIGYDFSTLRPSGDIIKKLGSHSSGPVSFMEIFNSVCACVASAGHRRGAQMAVMRVDHPDIEEFISCKQSQKGLSGFNISVAITDDFMDALKNFRNFDLKFEGEVYKTIGAADLWEKIMRSTWDWAEPGVLFIDQINNRNNLYYCETIAATNPCGEQPLPPFGACLLGSLNLTKYVVNLAFDEDLLISEIPAIIRAMDNVIDRTTYPLEEQRTEAENKRRMGIGITGLANVVELLGMPYGSPESVEWANKLMRKITNACYKASAKLAQEKGSFPLYDSEKYLEGHFIKTLDTDVISEIKTHGIRNSHLTSIAPCGTISLAANNVSSGVEPVFSKDVTRPINIPGHEGKLFKITDYGFSEWGVEPRDFESVTAREHVDMLCGVQQWVDSAVSKTCNVPYNIPWDDFKNIYIRAYENGAKGCTTYRMGGSKESLLTKSEDESCKFDPATGERSCE